MSDEEKAFWSDWTPEELARLKSIRKEMMRNWLAAGAPHGPGVVHLVNRPGGGVRAARVKNERA
jgi:hypothetical protein